MPGNTCKAKREDDDDVVRPKGKSRLSEVGSENAAGSTKSETLSSNNRSPNSGNSSQKSHKRFKSANEPAKEVEQRGKESNATSQRKKTLRAHIYRDRFRAHTTKVKASEGIKLQVPTQDLVSGTEVLVSETMNGGSIRDSTLYSQQKEKVAEGMLVQEGYDKQPEKKNSKYINKIKRSIKNLYERQSNEEEEFQKQRRAKKAKLEKSYKLESNVIHSILINSSQAMRNDRLKNLEANHRKKLDALNSEMDFELNAMKARHQTEIEEEKEEGIRQMKEWKKNGLFDERQSKEGFRVIEEVVPIKICSLEKENANVRRSAELHNDTAENSGSVEVAAVPTMCGNGAISKPPNAIQVNNEATTSVHVGKRTEDSLGVQENNNRAESVVAAEEVEKIATSKNDQLSTEIPTLQTEVNANEASERDPAARTEQNEEAGCSAHIESMNSPSTVNPSLVQPVTNQHQADSLPVSQENAKSCTRLIQLNIENSGSVEVAAVPTMCGNGAISKPPNAIQVNNEATTSVNVGKRTEDSLGVQGNNNRAESVVAAEEVEKIATSKNDQLSTEIPTLQTEVDANEASERDPAARTEQNEEAGCSAHIESMNSPSTVNPSLVQPVTNQHQADSLPVSQENAKSCTRLIQLNIENSGSVEVAAVPTMCGNGAISKPPNAIQVNNEATTSVNVGKRTEDSLGVQENNNRAESVVAAEEVKKIATSKNDQLSTEIPTLQTEVDANEASERDPAARTEQNEEAGCSAHIESMNSPSTVNPSLVQPVTNQHQADSLPVSQENAKSCTRLIQLNIENSGSVEVAAVPTMCGNGAISKPPNAVQVYNEATTSVNVGKRTEDSLGVQENNNRAESAVAAEEVEKIATSKNDQLFTEIPTLQTEVDANEASERDPAARTEQNEEAGCSAHIESMNSPSTVNPSLVQPVTNQHQADSLPVSQENAISCARLIQLNIEDVRAETSGMHNEMVQDNPVARTEQNEEAGCSTHIESMNSPSTLNPSLVQPVMNQHQADSLPVYQENAVSCGRLLQLNNEDVHTETSGMHNETIQDIMPSSVHSDGMPCNASEQALYRLAVPLDTGVSCSTSCDVPESRLILESSLPPEAPIQFQEDQRPLNRCPVVPPSVHSDGMPCNASDQALYSPAVPLDTGVSCSTSCDLPENQLMTENSLPHEAPIPFQEDRRPLNRWVEAPPPRPSLDASPYNTPLLNSSQSDSYMASRSVLPRIISQEFDPLVIELERIGRESNQVSKSHEDVVGRLKSECDKEIEDIVGEIRSKYESMVQEAEASFIQKKKEMDRNQWKVAMNIKLAGAFRRKCIVHRTEQQAAAAAGLTQQQQQQLLQLPSIQ